MKTKIKNITLEENRELINRLTTGRNKSLLARKLKISRSILTQYSKKPIIIGLDIASKIYISYGEVPFPYSKKSLEKVLDVREKNTRKSNKKVTRKRHRGFKDDSH